MKGFPTKHTKLEIPYRSIMHHSSCDTYIHGKIDRQIHTHTHIHMHTYMETHACLIWTYETLDRHS